MSANPLPLMFRWMSVAISGSHTPRAAVTNSTTWRTSGKSGASSERAREKTSFASPRIPRPATNTGRK